MKLPEPVAQIAFHYARNESNKITVDLPIETRLYSEAQMREALAQQEAAMRQALEALNGLFGIPEQWTGQGGGGVSVWRLGGSDQPRAAIKALEEQLK